MASYLNPYEEDDQSLDPRLVSYLRGESQAAPMPEREENFMDPNTIAGFAKAAAQMGSVGGKVADTDAVADAAKGIERDQLSRDKLIAGRQDDQIMKQLKIKQYLDSVRNKQADKEFRDEKFKADEEDRELKRAEIDERRAERWAARADAKAEKAAAKAAEPPMANQSTAAGFGRRIESANLDFEDLVNEGYDRTSAWEGAKSLNPTNYGKGEGLQRQEQAENNFLTAILRRESGASISPSEFAKGEELYFPRAGDTPGKLEQKKRNRDQALLNLKAESGKAWDLTPAVPRISAGAPPGASGMVKMQAPNGTIRLVPEDQIDAAIAAGGKRVN